MNRMWLGAVAVLTLVGCGGGGGSRAYVETDWVVDRAASVAVNYPDCVQYGSAIPNGAQIIFDVTDLNYDDMDVSVVPATAACDGSSGYGLQRSTAWYGTLSGNTGSLPAGTYDLAVSCYNSDGYPCKFTINTYGYLY